MSRILNFKTFVMSDMMEIEHVIEEVYTELLSGLNDFVCLDGGAHKGHHAMRLARLDGCIRVIAVEADPFMSAKLKTLIADDPEERCEIEVVQAALQDSPDIKSIQWQSFSSHLGRSSIISDNKEMSTIWEGRTGMEVREHTEVAATTIDTLTSGLEAQMPFMKLDLEGADLIALKGARSTLEQKRPVIAFENSVHSPKVHGFTIAEVIEYFHACGYTAVDFVGEEMTERSWFHLFEAWAVPN